MWEKHGLRIYLAMVHMCATAFLAWLFYAFPVTEAPWVGLTLWLLIGLGAHFVQFDSAIFGGQSIRRSVGFAADTAIAVLFSPPLAALLIAIGSISWRDLTGKTELHKALYNRSMYAVCGGLAALAYEAMPGSVGTAEPNLVLAGGLVAAIVYFLANHSMVIVVVAIASHRPLAEVYSFGPWYALVTYLTLGAMGVSLALVYTHVGILPMLVLSLPLLATYQALSHISLVQQFYLQVVQSFADSIDLREHETAGHSQRIAAFARRVGEAMGLRGTQLERLYIAGLLHDLGKLGWMDAILLKPGALTEEEWEFAKHHPTDGARLLQPYPHLRIVAPIIAAHHEKYDGAGYPSGLAHEEIPLEARILSVVDAFDAMYFGRPYRGPRPMREIEEELIRCSGTQFDPEVVETFLSLEWQSFVDENLKMEHQVAH